MDVGMLISLCIPCMNRVHSLKRVLPSIIESVNASPPVEITILDYSSTDSLDEYLTEIKETTYLVEGNKFNFQKITGKKYYHSTHARNLTVIASSGEYVIQLDTEIILPVKFVGYIRDRLETTHPIWMCEGRLGRCIVIQRDEFINSGGYDERFDVYAPEDKDICLRLHRRGGKFETFPLSLISVIETSNKEKLINLNQEPYKNGPFWIKRMMFRAMKVIYEENISNNVLVANEGKEWGKWI
jgi:glycosyltransferase involved in cell wall biosynthesis